MPSADADAPAELLIVGALPDVVEDQFRRLFAAMGIERVASLPPRRAADLSTVGPNTRFLVAQPFLGDTARALEGRGAVRLTRSSRSASRGRPLGCTPPRGLRCGRADLPYRDRAGPRARRRALERRRATSKAMSIFFFPRQPAGDPAGAVPVA
jgi:light-independent protochlorophyllide reductase subunit N